MCYALFWQIEAHIYEGVDVGMCLSIKIALPMKEHVVIQYHELCREARHYFPAGHVRVLKDVEMGRKPRPL
jgi:hypothetical protein